MSTGSGMKAKCAEGRPLAAATEALRPALPLLGVAAVASLLLQVLRLRNALRHAAGGKEEPGAVARVDPRAAPVMQILLAGDSAAGGLGAGRDAHTLAGRLAADHPRATIRVRARNGALMHEVRAQLADLPAPVDAVVVSAGGNDILRARSWRQLADDADALAAALARTARTPVWMGVANMGCAPLFGAPWSWWLSARTRRATGVFRRAAARHGVQYLDFFREASDDLFSREPARYFAPDGIHPSSCSYLHCHLALRDALAHSLARPARARRLPEADVELNLKAKPNDKPSTRDQRSRRVL